MKAIIKAMRYLNNPKAPFKWEWMILAVLLLIPFVSFYYGDTKSILYYEANFFASIFDGNGILSFYDYSFQKAREGGINGFGNTATYDFPMYIVLGIWGAPLWFFLGSKGIDAMTYFASKLYGKSILLVALVISAYLIYLICLEINLSKERAKWGAFLFASSMLSFTAIGLNGQTDILGVVFILLGLRAFIKEEKIQFLIYFAIAVTFKQYAIFIFVPLLLLIEKKIWRIITAIITALSILVASGLLFDPDSPAILNKKQFALDMYNRLTATRLPLLDGAIPVVIFLLMIVCIYCYLKKQISGEEIRKYAIFIPLLVMGIVFSSFDSSSYWYLHLTPYLAIMLVYNTHCLQHSFLFETFAFICLTLANYAGRPWSFDIYFCNGMLLEKIFGNYNAVETPILMENFCGMTKITQYCGVLYGGYVVLLFTVIYLCRPSQIRTVQEEIPLRKYALARLFINAFISFIPLLLYLYNVNLAGK